MRFKPTKLPRTLKVRGAIAVGIGAMGLTGVLIAQTTPAIADPTQTLVVVGSDTIQDVYNQFALDAGGNLIGSYNATNPVTNAAHEVITPVDGTAGVNCSFARPNGSTEGVDSLRLAINPATANGGGAVAPQAEQGCVDIARSSSGPTSQSLQSNTGPIVYIPFALDAVGGATGPTTCTPATLCPSFTADEINATTGAVTQVPNTTPVPTAITTADDFTLTDLENMYDSGDTVTEGGVTYWPLDSTVTKPAGAVTIDLYIPQPGSGTRSFWASTLGFSNTSPPAWDNDVIQAGALAGTNSLVEEHDGTAYATDPNAYGPFSIAQWISQSKGHNDRRHDAVIHDLNGISPFTTSGGLNSSYPITRDVYSVVSFARVTNSSDPLDGLLNGSNSFLCNEQVTILNYGFGLLPSTCGEVVAANRVLG
jgi:ABC-type phosphate transport system substrate-binding protein